jgi:hypothetical protein
MLWCTAESASEVAPFVSLALLDGSRGEACECENAGESRFRFNEPGEMLRRPASTAPPDCDMMSRSPHLSTRLSIAGKERVHRQ